MRELLISLEHNIETRWQWNFVYYCYLYDVHCFWSFKALKIILILENTGNHITRAWKLLLTVSYWKMLHCTWSELCS